MSYWITGKSNSTNTVYNYGKRKKGKFIKHPPPIKIGSEVVCIQPSSTTTRGVVYKVRGHFCYYIKGRWYEFFTIKNDNDYTIKVNKENYKCL